MTTNFNEIFDIKKAQYILEKYDDIKHNFREESEQRLKNMNIDPLTLFKNMFLNPKKEVLKVQKKLMYPTNKIIILVVILLVVHYHFKHYHVK